MSVQSRLAKLEQAMTAAATASSDRCPRCGVGWPGSVYLSFDDAGRYTPRCVRCDAERPHPGGPLKAYAAGLLAAL